MVTGLTGGVLYYFRVVANKSGVSSVVSLLDVMAYTTTTPLGTSTTGTHVDISVGKGTNSGRLPNPIIDYINGKLLVVTLNEANDSKLSLFRCNLDGTSCSHTDISAGQGFNAALFASPVIDHINGKLLVPAQNYANDSKLGLFKCNLDGTSCT